MSSNGPIPWEHEVVVDSVDGVVPVPIECPGCGEQFREALSDKLAGSTCHGCTDWIRYVRRSLVRDRGRGSEDTTEQSSLPVAATDGGRYVGTDTEHPDHGGEA